MLFQWQSTITQGMLVRSSRRPLHQKLYGLSTLLFCIRKFFSRRILEGAFTLRPGPHGRRMNDTASHWNLIVICGERTSEFTDTEDSFRVMSMYALFVRKVCVIFSSRRRRNEYFCEKWVLRKGEKAESFATYVWRRCIISVLLNRF